MARKAPGDLSQKIEGMTKRPGRVSDCLVERGKISSWRQWPRRMMSRAILPALFALAGCGGGVIGVSSSGSLNISPDAATIDNNCTGCNATGSSGQAIEQFSAMFGAGEAKVIWLVSGGDAIAGPGKINSSGQYTPPAYLTADSVQVTVTASLDSNPSIKASTEFTVRPGFLQPLTPENAALGAGETVTITGYIAEAGGTTGVSFAVASSSTGSSGGRGSVSSSSCARGGNAFTSCKVTYTAPASVSATGNAYVVATIRNSTSKEATEILLNTSGISSNPAAHQKELAAPVLLGSSGGNNNDYDARGNQSPECCGGTLGSLIQNSSGRQYLLSCNHVFARSDQGRVGETIVQPALIDNNCVHNGEGPGTMPVGILAAWLPLSASTTNVDAAIAQVDAEAVNPNGEILELGAQQGNGTLAAAPPGISSTDGKGEPASLNLVVAKSGRTTGLTCANVAVLDLTVKVDYFRNCAETVSYLTKTYTDQIAIEGNEFSDAGDSGSLVVDASDAEPVGLFFAGGVTNTGVTEGVANPAPTVLAELGRQGGTTYTFVGTTDHPVSCLNYGAGAAVAAQASAISRTQLELAQQALDQARIWIKPSMGVLAVATGKSSDHAGEAAVIFYVDEGTNVSVPQIVNGIRTEVIPTTARAVALGIAPQTAMKASAPGPLASAVFDKAVAAKEQVVQSLMQQNPAYFGVGVGQSLDDPREASLVIYVDRKQVPATLPPIINGLRTRYVIMDRLHVTRSYLDGPVQSMRHCVAHPSASRGDGVGATILRKQLGLQP
jgi:hypothetical protein